MAASTFTFKTPRVAEFHKHKMAQIMVGIKGITQINIEGNTVLLDQTTGCIIPPDEPHSFVGKGDNLNLVINIDLSYSSDIVKKICDDTRTFSVDRSIKNFLNFSAFEIPQYQGCANIGSNIFCQNLISVFTQLLSDRFFQGVKDEYRIDMSKINQFVCARMHQKITVEEMAKVAKISSSHFFKLFRQESGTSPYKYITEKRLEKAMFLLKTTYLPIADISFQTGFSSQSALNNAFKKRYNITPGGVNRFEKASNSGST